MFSVSGMAKTILFSLDNVSDDPRPNELIVAAISRADPIWVLVSNFEKRTLEVLTALSRPMALYWKVEYMGGGFTPFPADADIDHLAYFDRLLELAERVALYTFNKWNLVNILSAFPKLRTVDSYTQPVAQKPTIHGVDVNDIRQQYYLGSQDMLLGSAGVFHQGKGFDELVQMVISLELQNDIHFLFSLITDLPSQEVKSRWRRRYGESSWWENIHVRQGSYKEWAWMCSFYQSISALLVNSRSDSWGRVVSEAIGHKTPVIVRRDDDCGTNHICDGLTMVDSFHDLSLPSLKRLVKSAERQTERLAAYVDRHYDPDLVIRTLIANLRTSTPLRQLPTFDQLLSTGAMGDVKDAVFN